MKLPSLLALPVLAAAAALPASAAVIILDNFDATRVMPFSGAGGTTGTLADYDTADADNELQLARASNGSFAQWSAAFVGRSNTGLSTLAAGGVLKVDIIALSGTFTQDFAVRWVFNTDAWTSGSGNYRSFVSTTVVAGADRRITLSLDLDANPSIAAAALNYQGTGGTFFGLTLDNNGFPTNASAVTFAIDDVRVETAAIPEPSAYAALAGLAILGAAALRRRRA